MPIEGVPFLHEAGKWGFRLSLILLFRIRAWGAGNVPRQGGVLLASNHQSFTDPAIVGTAVTRPLYFMARRSLFDVPIFGRLIRAVNAFPVERGSADLAAIRAAIGVLANGRVLVVFPEGTRTPDGSVKEFKPGFAMLAARARVPIVPVAIDGAFEAWPRHQPLPWFHRVRVAYGEPVAAPADERGACRAAAELVQQRVAALQQELRRG
jgi:1-acyl-sn-glycerol-3-phosphate acyltransferase